MRNARDHIDFGHRALALLGAVLQAIAGFWVAASGLVAPPWGVAVLAAVWLSATIWALRHWRSGRFAVIIAFCAVAAFWLVFLLIGDAFFGFQA